MQFLAFLVLPGFFRVVAVVKEDGGGIPIQLFLRHEGTALKDQDILTGLGEVESESSATCAGADDDRVIFSRHGSKVPIGIALSLRTCDDPVPSPKHSAAFLYRRRVEVVAIGISGSHR